MPNLYIVATPIGNLQDITLRAARTLLESNVIIAESTSKAGILLEFLKKEFPSLKFVEKQIISLTEDEEENKIPSILEILKQNDGALISEAGTPLISDPGFKLVREAIKRDIRITPIPGPSSLTTALVASGLPTNKVTFLGFLPRSEVKSKREIGALKDTNSTVILFESPHRLVQTLRNVRDIFDNIEIVVARELTKIHEEIIRSTLDDAINRFEKSAPKGEFVVLFHS